MKLKNGTTAWGQKGSYWFLQYALVDLLKGKPKVFEVYHLSQVIKKSAERLGKTVDQIKVDHAIAKGES